MSDRLRVLVVDDNRDTLAVLQRFVARSDCDVRTCLDSKNAVDMVRDFLPQVIFLDIAMPELDGFEVAEDLHEIQLPEYMLVAVTSYSDNAHRRECEASGFDIFLAKPPSIDDVTALIEKAKERFLTSV